MAKLSAEKLERIKKAAEGRFLQSSDPDVDSFLQRMKAENADVFSDVFAGEMSFYNAPRRDALAEIDVAVVGVPFEVGAPVRGGTRLGPRSAREWSRVRGPIHDAWNIVPFEMCSVADYGDVTFPNPHDIDSCVERVAKIYGTFRENEIYPLSFGGVHTMTHPILRGLADGEGIGMVHIDAHCDTARGKFQGSIYNDCSVFLNAAVEGAIDPERCVQIGIRGSLTPFWSFSQEVGMRVIGMDEFFEIGVAGALAEIDKAIGDGPFYLTIDTDGIDATFLPGTQLPEPFGLTTREVLLLVRGLRGKEMIGGDLCELCPPYDPHGISANICGALGFEMLCMIAETHAKRFGRQRKTSWR